MIIHAIFRRTSYVTVCRLYRHEGTLYWVRESAFGCSYSNIERAREVFPSAIFLDREILTQKAFFYKWRLGQCLY